MFAVSRFGVPPLSKIDKILLPYVKAKWPRDAERELTLLISRDVEPTIDSVIKKRWPNWPGGRLVGDNNHDLNFAKEAFQEARWQSIRAIVRCRLDGRNIENALGYVYTIAIRECIRAYSRINPVQKLVENRLRKVLGACDEIAEWSIDKSVVVGLATWQKNKRASMQSSSLDDLLMDPLRAIRRKSAGFKVGPNDTVEPVKAALSFANHPIRKWDLIRILGALWNMEDKTTLSLTDIADFEGYSQQSENDNDELLLNTWDSLRQSAKSHVAALLLAGDGPAIIDAFVRREVATLEQIAAAMGFDVAWLTANYENLPLSDKDIEDILQNWKPPINNKARDLRRTIKDKLNRQRAKWEAGGNL